MRRNLLILSVATMLLAALAAAKLAVPDLPMPQEYVDDLANVINPEHKQALLGILQELEQKTGVQYIILTVETTGGLPIQDFSIELAHNRWKLGQKDKDNGLLFTLALKDRAYWFTIGYGLEGFVTDAFAGQVGRDVLVPYLKKGQYSQGIYEANLRVIQRIARETGVQLSGMPTLPPEPTAYNSPVLGQRRGPTCCVCPCCGLLVLLILFMMFFGGRGGAGAEAGGGCSCCRSCSTAPAAMVAGGLMVPSGAATAGSAGACGAGSDASAVAEGEDSAAVAPADDGNCTLGGRQCSRQKQERMAPGRRPCWPS